MGRLRLSHVPMLPNFLVECNLVQHMVRITGCGNVANTWCKEESMRKLSYLVTLSVIALLIFVPAAGAQQGQDVTVSIQNFAFNPPDITVTPGTTVTWVNNDSVPHYDGERRDLGLRDAAARRVLLLHVRHPGDVPLLLRDTPLHGGECYRWRWYRGQRW